jgi:iron complex transport system ATP-binding protein
MSDAPLQARGLTVAYDATAVVDGLELVVPRERITAIIGANGCGKSTLLRALARLIAPRAGSVLLDGRAIAEIPSRDVARRLGMLPQSPHAPDGLTVEDLVARGRYPHQGLFRQWSTNDAAAVEEALAATGTAELRGRLVDELSGGQRQRAWIAMTLAQQTELLLLDEPTTFLDLAHQVDVLDLLDDLVAAHGRTVVMVLHDVNQACRYADQLVAMRGGRVHAAGAPGEIVDETLIRDVFGLAAQVIADPVTGTPLCLPTAQPRRTRCTTA